VPLIGQSLGLLRALRSNSGERWLRDRVDRYGPGPGPVLKLSLFGAPTVFVTGPAAHCLVFASDALAPKQPRRCLPLILGRRNILEFDGYCIPKGWQVFWASSVTHMDPSIFPDPDKFQPSRFIKSQSPPYSFAGSWRRSAAARGCAPGSSSPGWRRW